MLALFVGYQLALAQAAQAAPEADFDLRQVKPAAAAETIVVTGRRRLHQRLPILPDLPDPILPHAQIRLFGDVQIGPDVGTDAGGTPSLMLRLKIPF